jgi:hypothetical protein
MVEINEAALMNWIGFSFLEDYSYRGEMVEAIYARLVGMDEED